MLGKSDRLRVFCAIFDLNMEEFASRLAARRNVSPANLREQVGDWWDHRHQPTKGISSIIAVLQERAAEKGLDIDVRDLWHKNLTPTEFVEACGKSVHDVSSHFSDITRRSLFEQVDRISYLRLMRSERELNPARVKNLMQGMAGTYFVYRIHSSERTLCREIVTIGAQSTGILAPAEYLQYAEGRRQRRIDLNLLVGEHCVHAVGAYRDEKADEQPQISMVHATIFNAPYRQRIFAGILLDVMDNGTNVAAQRILMRKISNQPRASYEMAVVVRDQEVHWMRNYRNFLRTQDDDDHFLLTADQGRITRILEDDSENQDF